ncbi:protein kinase domain-containing protein [Georgenia sp. Z1491]|uniref:protein kinase domain-containing protein n=1 Tax=Georgenia sp. Z1491 TaxID=3416707 RepID=UPI003CEA888A
MGRADDDGRVRVPGYRISRSLGGGSGRVYSATSDERGSPVIVSVVDLPEGRSGDAMRRRLAGLRTSPHPHLPRVLDVVDLTDGRAALVTEVVPGASLAAVRVARGALSVPEVAGVLTDIGSALAHLAAAGIVHGDVSPANVVVDTTGTVVLVDLVGDVRHEEGTPGHVAPERIAGGPASTASDVYALGMLVRGLAPGDLEVEELTTQACSDEPAVRPTARALAARAAELGGRSGVRLPAGADMAGALLREGALREATAHVPAGRSRVRPGSGGRAGRRARGGPGARGGRRARSVRPEQRARGAGRLPALTAGGKVAVLGVAAVVLVLGGFVTTRTILSQAEAPDATGAGTPAATQEPSAGQSQAPAPSGSTTGTSPEVTTESARGTAADAFDVVSEVVDARERALLAGDAAALADATVDGSPARAADAALTRALGTTTIADLSTDVTSVVLTEGGATDDRFVAEVSLRQEEWRASDATGERVYPSAETCRLLTLERVDDRWAVADADRCGPADQGG